MKHGPIIIDSQYSLFQDEPNIPFQPVKLCRACKHYHPLSSFGKEKGTVGLLKTSCKASLAHNAKIARAAKKLAGPSPIDGYQCPTGCGRICIRSSPTYARDWVPDHNPKTGKPRQWVCRECNTGFGKADDDPLILVGQMAYLIKHHPGYDLRNFEQIQEILKTAFCKSMEKSNHVITNSLEFFVTNSGKSSYH